MKENRNGKLLDCFSKLKEKCQQTMIIQATNKWMKEIVPVMTQQIVTETSLRSIKSYYT